MKSAYEIANEYGREMILYGKSLYWTSPRVVENPTPKLIASEDFKSLSKEDQQTVLNYGQTCKQYGMGCYQERGYCADLYHQLYMQGGPKNPFPKNKQAETQPQEVQPE